MEELAAGTPAGANGLVAIFSNVMNAKRWVQASPSFVQFDVDNPAATGRAACIRAIEEQAAYATRGHLKIIEELTGTTYDEVIFTGGASRGRLWPQIVADVTGLRVRVASVTESTALGAAIFAGLGAGLYRDLPEALARIVRFEDPIETERHERRDLCRPLRALVVHLPARAGAIRSRPRPPDVVAGRRPVMRIPDARS